MNTNTEALYTQCDPDGNQYIMLDTIVDERKNPDVAISWNNQVKIINSKKVVSFSTRGWELCCEWKDDSSSWQKLSDLKESHPLWVADFTLATGIADEPAFNYAKVLDTTSRPISLGLSSPKMWIKLMQSTMPLVLPFGVMQLNWR
ncbi:hypothetical protein ACHAW6_005711 [Cyclotella cf. meneghiniana]